MIAGATLSSIRAATSCLYIGVATKYINDAEKYESYKECFNHNNIILIINNIVVKSTDNLAYDLTIKFKLPYANDQLIYKDNKDNKDKSKGYILRD